MPADCDKAKRQKSAPRSVLQRTQREQLALTHATNPLRAAKTRREDANGNKMDNSGCLIAALLCLKPEADSSLGLISELAAPAGHVLETYARRTNLCRWSRELHLLTVLEQGRFRSGQPDLLRPAGLELRRPGG